MSVYLPSGRPSTPTPLPPIQLLPSLISISPEVDQPRLATSDLSNGHSSVRPSSQRHGKTRRKHSGRQRTVRPADDPHDLSLASANLGRDSLMDSMVMSLDQLSSFVPDPPEYLSFSDDPSSPIDPEYPRSTISSSSKFPPSSWRPGRAHSHSTSISSQSVNMEEAFPRQSEQESRAGTSNSGSSETQLREIIRASFPNSLRILASAPEAQSQRDHRSTAGASYHRDVSSELRESGSGHFASRYEHGLPYSPMDSAPTPTVPGGPRPLHSPFLPSAQCYLPTPTPPRTPKLERRRSNRSSKSLHGRGVIDGDNSIPRVPTRKTHLLESGSTARPPLTADSNRSISLAAPNDGRGGSSEGLARFPTRDRPGFFHRLFSSSKSRPNTASIARSMSMATTVLDPADQISEPTALSMLKSDSENPMDPSSTGQLKKSTSAFFRRKKKVMAADLLPPLPLGGQAYQGPQSERATPPTEIQRREAHQDFQSKGTDRNRAQQRPEIPTLDRLGAKTMEEHTLHTSTIRAIPQSPAVPQFHERSLDPYNRHIAHVSQKANQARPRVKHRPRTSPAGPTAISIPDHESSDNPGQGEIVRVAPRTTSVGKTNKLSNAISLDRLNERLLIHDPDSVMRSRRENASTSKPLRESQLLREKVSDSKHEAGEANGQSQTQNRDLASISDDWDRAQLIYDGKEGSIPKDRLAAWLGDNDPVSARTLTTYMKLFNLSALNILTALRVLCSKLILRGETQQVDRILSAFSERWFQCNAQNGFIHQDIVHTLCYSILLLNTDLHVAEIPFSQKMTRNQFVKNTLATVRAVRSRLEHPEEASSEDRSDAHKNQDLNDPAVTKLPPSSFHTRASDGAVAEGRPSMESIRSVRRQSQSLPPDSEPLVSAPSIGSVKVWEQQIDRILRDFYASIRSSALPLHDGEANTDLIDYECDAGRLLLRSQVLPKRTMSVLSKSTTDSGQPISKGDNRTLGSKWVHRHRPRPRLYPMSTGGSSRTSFDDGESPMWSPNESSTWSKHSLVKTGTSVSVDSLGPQTQKPAYGFASSLNNAMHREDSSPLATDQPSPALIEDRLELAGAPWAKEGLLKHKHILEAVNKKARHRAWLECFVVVQRGWLRLFSFHNKASTTRSITDGVVGGGNWLQNASPIDSFALRHSYAFTMPLGISKDRPHTWTLYLASGATHLFQAGTEEVAREFVLTTNYWSARSSREPLAGGISNLEYGWSSNVLKPIDRSVAPAPEARATGSSSSKHSHQDVGAAPLPGDSVMISTWVVPNQSTLSSVLTETEQLENLAKHVKAVDLELRQHSEIRPRLILSYSSRHPNLIKALTNWERRNVYLKRECNRQRLYLDAIRQAIKEREAIDEKKEKTVAA